MSPHVTVITPAYNVAPFIRQAAASVLAQSFADLEYIVVDDGSTDETLAVARSAVAGDARATVLAMPHAGASAARNHALRAAKGEFISFLDGDDLWLPGFLERQLREMQAQGPDCAATFCQSLFIDENGAPLEGGNRFPSRRWYLADMMARICPPGNGSSLLLRAAELRSCGFFDESLVSGQDSEMWYRVLDRHPGRFFQSFQDQLVRYRKRPGSLTSLHRDERFRAKRDIYRRYARRLTREQSLHAFMALASSARTLRDDAQYRYWSVRAFF
ncbi:MAG: glycosyltransferase family 2 protein, partial [Elusimicrobia bacterium]|nr:glycosyltransferase family 2 protein [Elusimicrobiota bacterium]